MTLASVGNAPIYWPPTISNIQASSPGWASGAYSLLDYEGEAFGLVFPVPKTGTISKLSFRTSTLTTGDTVRVGLETVDSVGDPSGSYWDTNTYADLAVSASNTWYQATLTAGASVTKDQYAALTVRAPTGYAGNFYGAVYYRLLLNCSDDCYFVYNIGSGWGRTIADYTNYRPAFRIEYSDGTYGWIPGVLPAAGIGEANFHADSSSYDELGVYFKSLFDCEACGLLVTVELDGNNTVRLYDSSDNVLGSFDQNYRYRADSYENYYYCPFASGVELSADSYYRMTYRPTTTTTAIGVPYLEVDDVDQWAQVGLPIADYCWTQRVDDGSWTNDTTKIPLMSLGVDKVHKTASGGGATTVVCNRRRSTTTYSLPPRRHFAIAASGQAVANVIAATRRRSIRQPDVILRRQSVCAPAPSTNLILTPRRRNHVAQHVQAKTSPSAISITTPAPPGTVVVHSPRKIRVTQYPVIRRRRQAFIQGAEVPVGTTIVVSSPRKVR